MNKTSIERPLICKGEMVKAILYGRKTQTRRIVKPQPSTKFDYCRVVQVGKWFHIEADKPETVMHTVICPYGQPGDKLWIRETWQLEMNSGFYDIRYKADNYLWDCGSLWIKLNNRKCWIWRPSIHMPRWASRITLEIVDVRVERLQAISKQDALADTCFQYEPIGQFAMFWDTLYPKKPEYQWKADPWLWVIGFKKQ